MIPHLTHVLPNVFQASGFLAMVLLTPTSAIAQMPLPPEPRPESLSGPALDSPAGGEGATDTTWVVDSLSWLDQAVAAQASWPSSGAQADSLGLLPSSPDSSDLQPIDSPPAREELFPTPLAQSLDIAETTSAQSQSDPWHFLVVPYIYVPFNISGSVNFSGTKNFTDNFSRDFNLSQDFEFFPSQVIAALQNSLNFAFFGGIEAWTPDYTLGILGNLDYISLSTSSTFTREVRFPGLANFIPAELNSALNTQLWTVDLAASYRLYDPTKVNPEGVYTEFDLGPFVFDIVGGLNMTQVNAQLGLSTNLGGNGQFTSSNTVFSPLLGGRFRWNANPQLALLASGSVSGFGISGLMQYEFQGGVDWIFSGNTSLGLGYRFGFVDYTQSAGDFNLSLDQNGPYLDFGFRF